MATRTIVVSDFTEDDIPEDDKVTVIVKEHPSIEEPVKLDAANADLAPLRKNKRDYAIIEVTDAEGVTERIIVTAEAFNKLFKGDAEEVLEEAEVIKPEPVRIPAAAKPVEEPVKLDYKSILYAGRPHRGKTTEEEKQMVRENLDQINANLKAAGIRQVDLMNPDHVERYDLQELVKEQGLSA